MRPRTRDAVSGVVFQIGSSTFITSAVSMLDTGNPPIAGYTLCCSDWTHCRAWIALQPPS